VLVTHVHVPSVWSVHVAQASVNVDNLSTVCGLSHNTVIDGIVLFILSTVATAVPAFHTQSINSNVNVPFSVNVYVSNHPLFVIVISSLTHHTVSVAVVFVL